MTSIPRIRDILLATSQVGRLAPTCIPIGDPDEALRRLARDIDWIVLARRILVMFTDSTSLALDVRHRRLLRYVHLPDQQMVAAAEHMPAAPGLNSDDCPTIAAGLRTLLADRTIRTVRIIEDANIDFPHTSGVSATALLGTCDALDVVPMTLDLEGILSDFIELTSAGVVAACVIADDDADIVAISGTDDSILAMADWADRAVSVPRGDGSGMLPPLETGGIGAIGWSAARACQLLIVRAPHGLGLILVDGSDSLECLTTLRDIMER